MTHILKSTIWDVYKVLVVKHTNKREYEWTSEYQTLSFATKTITLHWVEESQRTERRYEWFKVQWKNKWNGYMFSIIRWVTAKFCHGIDEAIEFIKCSIRLWITPQTYHDCRADQLWSKLCLLQNTILINNNSATYFDFRYTKQVFETLDLSTLCHLLLNKFMPRRDI